MKEKQANELLQEFSEYCHKNYMGCSVENGRDIYSYNTEVVCMIEGFLNEYRPNFSQNELQA